MPRGGGRGSGAGLAVHVGGVAVREAAWWELWGNLHHQGPVYEATAYAVPFVSAVAEDRGHPDRIQALAFLRDVAIGDGEAAEVVRADVRSRVPELLRDWAHEPVPVRRALLWLASAFPEVLPEYPGLVRVPDVHRAAWDVLIADRKEYEDLSGADEERREAFEQWMLAGWVPSG